MRLRLRNLLALRILLRYSEQWANRIIVISDDIQPYTNFPTTPFRLGAGRLSAVGGGGASRNSFSTGLLASNARHMALSSQNRPAVHLEFLASLQIMAKNATVRSLIGEGTRGFSTYYPSSFPYPSWAPLPLLAQEQKWLATSWLRAIRLTWKELCQFRIAKHQFGPR